MSWLKMIFPAPVPSEVTHGLCSGAVVALVVSTTISFGLSCVLTFIVGLTVFVGCFYHFYTCVLNRDER